MPRLPACARLAALSALVATAAATSPWPGTVSAADAAPAYQVNDLAAYAVAVRLEADRAWVHLGALSVDPALDQLALQHSIAMAQSSTLFDTPDPASIGSVVAGWTRVGQNSGYGSSPEVVNYAFVHSTPHLANILGPYDLVGVGAVSSGGRLWVTEDFAAAG